MKLSAPPSVSDTLLTPLVTRVSRRPHPERSASRSLSPSDWSISSPRASIWRSVWARFKDSCLVARRVLTYRHQLVASPSYLKTCRPPKEPRDLLDHRLLTFSHWKPENSWTFVHKNGMDKETLTFQPHFSMNDYTGLASQPWPQGPGCGDLPPVVQPRLIREGRLVEVIPRLAVPHLRPFARPGREPPHPPSHAGCFKDLAGCKWRQVCFPTCRRERPTANSAVAIGHQGQRQVAHLTSAALRSARTASRRLQPSSPSREYRPFVELPGYR